MLWLFAQIWVWCLLGVVLGLLLGWLFFALPLRKKLRATNDDLDYARRAQRNAETAAVRRNDGEAGDTAVRVGTVGEEADRERTQDRSDSGSGIGAAAGGGAAGMGGAVAGAGLFGDRDTAQPETAPVPDSPAPDSPVPDSPAPASDTGDSDTGDSDTGDSDAQSGLATVDSAAALSFTGGRDAAAEETAGDHAAPAEEPASAEPPQGVDPAGTTGPVSQETVAAADHGGRPQNPEPERAQPVEQHVPEAAIGGVPTSGERGEEPEPAPPTTGPGFRGSDASAQEAEEAGTHDPTGQRGAVGGAAMPATPPWKSYTGAGDSSSYMTRTYGSVSRPEHGAGKHHQDEPAAPSGEEPADTAAEPDRPETSGPELAAERTGGERHRATGATRFGKVDGGEPPFGPGSVVASSDGAAPGPEYTVKGSRSARVYHSADSPYFERTRADVWFTSEDAAERAGFTSWSRDVHAAVSSARPTAYEPGPYPGSALPKADGSTPSDEFRIKGSEESLIYHSTSSPYFVRTRAEVWFRTEADAEQAGFTAWNRPRR